MENSAQYINVEEPHHNKTCRTITGLLTPISIGMILSALRDYQRVLITPPILLTHPPGNDISRHHTDWHAYRQVATELQREHPKLALYIAVYNHSKEIVWKRPGQWNGSPKSFPFGKRRHIAGIYVDRRKLPHLPKYKLFIPKEDKPQQKDS